MVDASQLDAIQLNLSPVFQRVMSANILIMMFSVALSLKVDDFKQLRREPVAVLGGVAGQILGLPLLTLLLVFLLQPHPGLALGMIVVAACPGGAISNVLTLLSRGDTAYSVSLTAVSSLLSAVVTPVSILLWASLYPPTAGLLDELAISPLPFLSQMVTLLAIPTGVGMWVAHYHAERAAKIRKILTPLALSGIAVLILVGLIGNFDLVIETGAITLPLVVLHNSLALAFGFGLAWLLSFGAARRRALTFEIGIQNSGLGLLILLSHLGAPGGALTILALWGIWHFFSGMAVMGVFRWLAGRSDTLGHQGPRP